MKRLHYIFLLIIITGCSSEIKLIRKGKFKSEGQHTQEILNAPLNESESVESSVDYSPELIELDDSEDVSQFHLDNVIERVKTFEENNLDNNTYSEALESINRQRKVNKEGTSDATNAARVFFIIGGIFFLIALIFLIKYIVTQPEDEATAEGCLVSLFGMLAALIFAVIFGTIALIFAIIGLAILASANNNANNNRMEDPPIHKT